MIETIVFFSAIINLVYFNYYLYKRMSLRYFRAVIDQNKSDEGEAIKIIATLIVAFIVIICYDVFSFYSLYQNFSLANILSFGSDAVSFSITLVLDFINELLPSSVYDFVEYLFGKLNITLDDTFLSVIGLIVSLILNYVAFISIRNDRRYSQLAASSNPKTRLLEGSYDRDSLNYCYTSLLLFESTGYFPSSIVLSDLLSIPQTPSLDSKVEEFNGGLKTYFEENDVMIMPLKGGQSRDKKYHKKRLKYIDEIYKRLYAELSDLTDRDKKVLYDSMNLIFSSVKKAVVFSNVQTDSIRKAIGTGDFIKDLSNSALRIQESKYNFRAVVGGESDAFNQICLVLSQRLAEFAGKTNFTLSDNTSDFPCTDSRGKEILNMLFDYVLEGNPTLAYSDKEKSDFAVFLDNCLSEADQTYVVKTNSLVADYDNAIQHSPRDRHSFGSNQTNQPNVFDVVDGLNEDGDISGNLDNRSPDNSRSFDNPKYSDDLAQDIPHYLHSARQELDVANAACSKSFTKYKSSLEDLVKRVNMRAPEKEFINKNIQHGTHHHYELMNVVDLEKLVARHLFSLDIDFKGKMKAAESDFFRAKKKFDLAKHKVVKMNEKLNTGKRPKKDI